MTPSERRLAHRLVAAAAAATFVVIVASAFIRHAQTAYPVASDFARILHRLFATAALLVVVMVPFMLLRGDAAHRERRPAHVARAIVVALALRGVATPGSTSLAVMAGNLVGGFALLATLAVLAARLRDPSASRDRLVTLAVAGAIASLATGALAWVTPSLTLALLHNATAALATAGLAAAYLGRPAG